MAHHPVRLVCGGVFRGREDTLRLEDVHADDKSAMVRPPARRRAKAAAHGASACQLPPDHCGIVDMWARPRTPQKKAQLRRELNAAMRAEQRAPQEHERRGQELLARRGLQLSTEIRAEKGLEVVHCDRGEANGMRGIVTAIETGVMGETCSVRWENGAKGHYSSLELRTAEHKRRHGPRDEVPLPPTRPGPAPYCMAPDGPHGRRPFGLKPPPQRPPPALGDCGKGAFRLFQYQPEVQKRNQVNMYDDLQQRAGFPGAQNYCK